MQDVMQHRLEDVKAQVQAALEEAMAHLPPGELTDAMRYACIGGKRIRAFLVMESARMFGIEDSAALPVAAAVHLQYMAHTFLIHPYKPCCEKYWQPLLNPSHPFQLRNEW